MAAAPAASFKFNNFQEIKSHSSILYNERMAILFYLLDMHSIEMNKYYDSGEILQVRALLLQIYKNIRMLLRNNPTVRATLNLETKDEGSYVTDVAWGIIDSMVKYCETYGWTAKRNYILSMELNKLEMMIKDIMQYFHYFIRPDFRQKPDVDIATESYKEIADKTTIEELKKLVGKNHGIDFEGLGSTRISVNEELEDMSEVDEEEDDEYGYEGDGRVSEENEQ